MVRPCPAGGACQGIADRMAWTDYSAAPEPGTPLCNARDVQTVLSLAVRTARGNFPMLVVRTDDGLRAYVNACPHQHLPLDHRGGRILSADRARLMCTAHGARFDVSTGKAIDGAECGLDAVPVAIRDGMVVIDRI